MRKPADVCRWDACDLRATVPIRMYHLHFGLCDAHWGIWRGLDSDGKDHKAAELKVGRRRTGPKAKRLCACGAPMVDYCHECGAAVCGGCVRRFLLIAHCGPCWVRHHGLESAPTLPHLAEATPKDGAA